ncbi:MAG: hypothetical protein H5U29_10570 [Pusillimonas sp.]|nr:hypothetical protein [Pusillimonas sp.]
MEKNLKRFMEKKNLKRLVLALEDWLVCQGLKGDVQIFEGANSVPAEFQWPQGALVVWMYDSVTHSLIHIGSDYFDLQDLIRSYGFRSEFSHDHSMAIFVDQAYDFAPLPEGTTYKEALEDERWKEKAERIKIRALRRCEDCGVSGSLQAHHCYYARKYEGMKPWEYPLSAFRALCKKCHESREIVEMRFRAWTAKLTQQEIEGLQRAVDRVKDSLDYGQLIEMLLKSSPQDLRDLYKSSTGKPLR